MTQWSVPPSSSRRDTRAALFLDRDGVVVKEKDYLADPNEVELLPGAAEAMARARQAGFLLIGISNQSGIGRGLFSEAEFSLVMKRLVELLGRLDVGFDAFFYCPHAPDLGCGCRKPARGLLDEASRHFGWEPSASYLIGDKLSDIELGRAAGLRSYLVRTGYGAGQEAAVIKRWPGEAGVQVVDDLQAAVRHLLHDIHAGG